MQKKLHELKNYELCEWFTTVIIAQNYDDYAVRRIEDSEYSCSEILDEMNRRLRVYDEHYMAG
jgi:hypothetical protein